MTIDDLKTALVNVGMICNAHGAYVEQSAFTVPMNPVALRTFVAVGNNASKTATEVATAIKQAASGNTTALDGILHGNS